MLYCAIACFACLVIGYILGVVYASRTKVEVKEILDVLNNKIDQLQEEVNKKIDELQKRLGH